MLRYGYYFIILFFINIFPGLQYANVFRAVAGNNLPRNVIVHGLSFASTRSAPIQDNILREAMHMELTEFVKNICKFQQLF